MLNFKRVFIANRGEIACRIIRTLRELNMESVVIYSDADRHSLHVKLADWAIHLPGVASKDTYLNQDAILKAINASGANAVHPGFGFLSENADFAEALGKYTSAKFIGPSPNAIRVMGNKVKAKEIMRANGVPVVKGGEKTLSSLRSLEEEAKEIGYPIILKAAAGGGGRGMRVVTQDDQLKPFYEACAREAEAYFGDGSVFCERYIANPRHIEFQVLFDEHGNGVHLFERDCSIQRRHQKLFEEAPSCFLGPEERANLGAIAVKAAKAAGYSNAGTIEFICESPKQCYFMEMNTRIQVEHPVTEAITGLDLIKEQIRVASGQRLPFKQEDLSIRGWSMEARLNAEDPRLNFIPVSGKVRRLHLPLGPFVRFDSHLYQGYEIPTAYDSMLAKLIVWGQDRREAMDRMLRALREFALDGFPTTACFQEALLMHPDFQNGNFTTNFIEKQQPYFQSHWQKPHPALSTPEITAISSWFLQKQFLDTPSAPSTSDQSLWTRQSRVDIMQKGM